MSASDITEKRDFLLKFFDSGPMQSFENAFASIIGKKRYWLLFGERFRKINGDRPLKRIPAKVKTRLGREIITWRGKKDNLFTLIIPVAQGQTLYGYIVVPSLSRELKKNEKDYIRNFIDVGLREFQKEQELTRLYDTIRPRAIALSTIHTIHRLLTSTLEMDELIERIARLTSQVMRSRYCSIMLIDETGRYLVPRAVVDLKRGVSKINGKRKKIKIGHMTLGKVAKSGKTDLSYNSVCVPLVEEDVIGVICARDKTNNSRFNKFDLEILLTLAEQAVIAIRNAQLYEEQKKMAYGSIKSLAALLDMKFPHAYTHSEEFTKIVMAIAEEMKLPREDIRNLRFASLLPDTGKFTLPDEILKKRGGLSRKEFGIIKKQHLESLKILEPLEFLKPAMPIIVHHHERYDGSGYPNGLKGNEIPMGARIMAVADAFEAMISSRPYKDYGISVSQAIKEIESNKGTQFDPEVVDAFMEVLSKNEKYKDII